MRDLELTCNASHAVSSKAATAAKKTKLYDMHALTRTKNDAIKDCVERYYRDVLAYCKHHAPRGYEPQDICQETFLRFLQTPHYSHNNRPLPYLITIARNLCIDAHRHMAYEPISLECEPASNYSLENTVESSAAKSALGSALLTLPPSLREIVELKFDSQLKVKEIAEILGISRFSVRRRINEALKLLKQELSL